MCLCFDALWQSGYSKKVERLKMSRSFGVTFFSLSLALAFSANAQQKLIVKMKGGQSKNPFSNLIVKRQNARNLASEMQSQSNNIRTKELKKLGIVVLEVADSEVDEVKAQLAHHPLVEYAEEDVSWELAGITCASDNCSATSAYAPWLDDVMGLDESSPSPSVSYSGSSPVVVAVVDTGATYSHNFLSSAIHVNEEELAGDPDVDDDGNGYVDDIYGANVLNNSGDVDDSGTDHGSHVAGLIKTIRDQAIAMGYSNSEAVEILPIRFINSSGNGSTSGAIEALEYAAQRGAKVVNASWGAQGSSAYSQALFETMADLYLEQDIVITAAAGNFAINNNNNPFYPANFSLYIPGVISVASLTSFCGASCSVGELSIFSNYGRTAVDVAAPGAMATGSGASLGGVYSVDANTSDEFVRKEGTSMASPVVAGVAAVIRAIRPALTAYEVKQVIMNTSVYSAELDDLVAADGYVHAKDAFDAALLYTTSGLQPQVTQPSFSSSSSSASTVGGCGSIGIPPPGSSNGPWGGNSLLLVLSLYLVVSFTRQKARQIVKNRNK